MTTNMDAFQELLTSMRAEFLSEMLERCDRFDELILA